MIEKKGTIFVKKKIVRIFCSRALPATTWRRDTGRACDRVFELLTRGNSLSASRYAEGQVQLLRADLRDPDYRDDDSERLSRGSEGDGRAVAPQSEQSDAI